MPFNGSGTFTHTTSGTPVVTATVISSTMFNAVLAETATGLSTCIAKDGQTTTTASIPFAAGISVSTVAILNCPVTVNDSGADVDFVIESDANPSHFVSDGGLFSGKGAFAFGSSVATHSFILVNPPAITAPTNTDHNNFFIANTDAITIPSGTANVVSALRVLEPNIVATGTVTVATTVLIEAAPTEGSENYALLVQAGACRFNGSMRFGTHSAIAAETVTGYITITDAAGNSRKLAVVS